MQHQDCWLKSVHDRLRALGQDPSKNFRTWLRLPYCMGLHMNREGCTFAYLSPDADAAGQRVWLRFPVVHWRNGGIERIACALMELEVSAVRTGWVTHDPHTAVQSLVLGLDSAHCTPPQPCFEPPPRALSAA